jgi:hypothetical protein
MDEARSRAAWAPSARRARFRLLVNPPEYRRRWGALARKHIPWGDEALTQDFQRSLMGRSEPGVAGST